MLTLCAMCYDRWEWSENNYKEMARSEVVGSGWFPSIDLLEHFKQLKWRNQCKIVPCTVHDCMFAWLHYDFIVRWFNRQKLRRWMEKSAFIWHVNWNRKMKAEIYSQIFMQSKINSNVFLDFSINGFDSILIAHFNI